MRADDRYLIVNPFFHTFGYKAGWLAALSSGATVLPHLVFQPADVLRRVADDRVSVLPGPPTLYYALLDAPDRATRDLSSLRIAVTGAAAIAPSLIERMRAEARLRDGADRLRLTESCGFATLPPGRRCANRCLYVGAPDAGYRTAHRGPGGAPLGPDETGEIWVRGYNVMRGYFNQPDATRETVDADGWLHTGDLGCVDANGNLKITDRIKDMFIVGGFNCYPAEIERLLAAHPAIAQVALVGVPDTRLGEVGHAYVVLRPGAHADADELNDWARRNMANYKVPRHFTFVEQLPTSAAGKVLKYRLRAGIDAAA